MVLVYQATLDLLHQYEVHPEIVSQMFAYLFFFSNTLLFNQLMEKGESPCLNFLYACEALRGTL